MTEEEAKIWRKGFEDGVNSVQRKESEALKIGKAIMEVMYEKFQTVEEDY